MIQIPKTKYRLHKNETSGQVDVQFICPKCQEALNMLPLNTSEGYNVMEDGRVGKEIACGNRLCNFLDYIQLLDFDANFFRGQPLTGEGTPIE